MCVPVVSHPNDLHGHWLPLKETSAVVQFYFEAEQELEENEEEQGGRLFIRLVNDFDSYFSAHKYQSSDSVSHFLIRLDQLVPRQETYKLLHSFLI